jgi:hypothetical protein
MADQHQLDLAGTALLSFSTVAHLLQALALNGVIREEQMQQIIQSAVNQISPLDRPGALSAARSMFPNMTLS